MSPELIVKRSGSSRSYGDVEVMESSAWGNQVYDLFDHKFALTQLDQLSWLRAFFCAQDGARMFLPTYDVADFVIHRHSIHPQRLAKCR